MTILTWTYISVSCLLMGTCYSFMLKVNKRNRRKRCEICSKLKTGFFIGLLLKPGPRDPGSGLWIRTLKNLDPEKPGTWKTCEIVERRKNIRRPNSIILLTLEICHEETFKQAFREICYWRRKGNYWRICYI